MPKRSRIPARRTRPSPPAGARASEISPAPGGRGVAIAVLSVAIPAFLAFGWRLAYLQRLSGTPLSETMRGDAHSYWDWASYLLGHSFVGTNPFFQGPLYAYVLAALRGVLGSTPADVFLAQMVWSACAVALLADVLRRRAGPLWAIVLGSAVALNTMWVFFDGLILAESLLLFLEALLLWLWDLHSRTRRTLLVTVASTLVIGLLAQGRATAAILLLPQLFLIREAARSRGRPWMREGLLSLLLLVLCALPSAIWNHARTGSWIPYTYNAGLNFYIGNNPRADGGYVWVDGARLLGAARAHSPDGGVEFDGRDHLRTTKGLALRASESNTYWARAGLEYALAHPVETGTRSAYKALLMLNRSESPQIEHVSVFERLAGPVGAPIVGGFAVLGVLGLAAVPFAGRWGAFGLALRLYLAAIVLATVPFFVTDRYRIHLLPATVLLAGLSAEALARAAKERWRPVFRSTAISVAVAGCVVFAPLGIMDRNYESWLASSDLGLRWLEVGDAARATEVFGQAARLESRMPQRTSEDVDVRRDRARLHFNFGVALRRVRGNEAALPEWEAAVRLDDSNARYLRTLSDAYRLMGRPGESDSLLRLARTRAGGEAEFALSEGFRAAREQRYDDAQRDLERAVAEDSRLYAAWGGLIRIRVLRQDLVAADSTLERARMAGLPGPVATVYAGLLAAKRGDTTAARAALAQTVNDDLDPTLDEVKRWIRALIGETPGPPGHAHR